MAQSRGNWELNTIGALLCINIAYSYNFIFALIFLSKGFCNSHWTSLNYILLKLAHNILYFDAIVN